MHLQDFKLVQHSSSLEKSIAGRLSDLCLQAVIRTGPSDAIYRTLEGATALAAFLIIVFSSFLLARNRRGVGKQKESPSLTVALQLQSSVTSILAAFLLQL